MATVKVTCPVAGYTGHVAGIEFKDGVATVDSSDLDALAYFRRHGYTIGDQAPKPQPDLIDPRDLSVVTVGTKLRDAAVDPRPGDFLPPTNAGQANPHGPEVISPGLHANPPGPIVPGPVSRDPKVQEAVETTAAAEAMGVPAPEPSPARRRTSRAK